MRNLIVLTIVCVAFGLVTVTGCANKKKAPATGSSAAISPSVTDITPSPQPAVAYQPTAAPVAPASYDTSVTTTPTAGGAGAGSSYTVKKGDTLYGIARSKYGDGKQYTKIVAANPGVSPQSLKVGQTLVIP